MPSRSRACRRPSRRLRKGGGWVVLLIHMQSPTAGSPKRRAKFAIGGGIIVLALLGLVVWAMTRPNATSFYYTTSELQTVSLAAGTEEYRVNGNVVPASVVKDGLRTTFDITDGTTPVTVVTDET